MKTSVDCLPSGVLPFVYGVFYTSRYRIEGGNNAEDFKYEQNRQSAA